MVMTSKDGPVAGTYTRVVADDAMRNLRILYPGTRVWVVESNAAEIQQKDLEVLACRIDAEITTAHRVMFEGVVQMKFVQRQTLRGLINSRIFGNQKVSQGEAWRFELAQSHAKFARDANISDHRVRFTF
ncbi:hypothetical protein GCM10008957_30830 [Deinococcus ruber]|uniref:Uncharacterized protein n=2 Tax=Deinococcus ruber TaxID=1848197 RepID=A0A918CCF7_9DEIO|nr:hypothetical protein GCM10008957_30830 [Deinococcus ruber]